MGTYNSKDLPIRKRDDDQRKKWEGLQQFKEMSVGAGTGTMKHLKNGVKFQDKFYFIKANGLPIMYIDQNSNIYFSADALLSWASGRKITAGAANIEIDGGLIVDNVGNTAKVASNGFNIYGGDNGASGNSNFITALDYDGDQLRYKYRNLTFTNGIITDFGSESGWNNVS